MPRVRAVAVAAMLLLHVPACSPRDERLNLLLVTIDTLRADHLGCYDYARQTSPFLDGLASEGARFARCYTTVPITLPAHSSLMTGTYPLYHGVRDNARYQHLDDSNETLAEALREAGYETAAVVSAFPLDARFGIAQGFRHYDDAVDEPYLPRAPGDRPPDDPEGRLLWERQRSRFQQRAGTTTKKASTWLRGRDCERPFFLWVHYFDPHDPYEPPSPYDRMFSPVSRDFLAVRTAAYDGEIRYTDDQIRELLQTLVEEEQLDRTLVVVTSDHGEGLGQHAVGGRPDLYHGSTLFEEGLRVPLVLRAPGLVPAGRVVEDRVGLVDLAPTVLDLLGLAIPEASQGRSVRPLLHGETVEERDLFFETLLPLIREGQLPQKAYRDDRWKLIRHGEEREELYDLSRDPGERTDLAGKEELAGIVEDGRRRIAEWEARVTNVREPPR